MKIVPYHPKYRMLLSRMLLDVGIPKEDQCFDKYTTFCLIGDYGKSVRGFYTECLDDIGLTLKHFYVSKRFRNCFAALTLWLHFKKRNEHRAVWFVNIDRTDAYLRALLCRICNPVKNYLSNKHEDFYLVSFRR